MSFVDCMPFIGRRQPIRTRESYSVNCYSCQDYVTSWLHAIHRDPNTNHTCLLLGRRKHRTIKMICSAIWTEAKNESQCPLDLELNCIQQDQDPVKAKLLYGFTQRLFTKVAKAVTHSTDASLTISLHTIYVWHQHRNTWMCQAPL